MRAKSPLFATVLLAFSAGTASLNGAAADPLAQARALHEAKRYPEAAQAYRQANQEASGTCAPCLTGLAQVQIAMKDFPSAIASAKQATQLKADAEALSEAYVQLGAAQLFQALANGSKLTEAERSERKAVGLSNGKAGNSGRVMLGQILLQEGREAEARAIFAQYLEREPNGPSAAFVRSLAGSVQAPDPTSLKLVTVDDQPVRLGDYAGKVVLLDFWATWCGPCRQSLPGLIKLRESLRSEPFALVSIGCDLERKKVRDFVATHQMDWTQVWDDGGAAQKAYHVQGLPTYLLLDSTGKVIYATAGWSPQSESRLAAEVTKAVKAARQSPSGAAKGLR